MPQAVLHLQLFVVVVLLLLAVHQLELFVAVALLSAVADATLLLLAVLLQLLFAAMHAVVL